MPPTEQPTRSNGPEGGRRPIVLYIGGVGRSGSTVISRALGTQDSVSAVGELRFIWDQGVIRNRACGCGEHFLDCVFWDAVGREALGGWDVHQARDALAMRKKVDRTRAVALLASARRPAGFTAVLREYGQLMGAVHGAVAKVGGSRVVVDSSKYPSTGFVMRHEPGIDLRLMHLVRASHGVAHSWTKHVVREDREGAEMARYPSYRTAIEWDVYNVLLHGLSVLGVPRLFVRYEDFVAMPRAQLDRILAFVDRPAAPSGLFTDESVIDLPASHSIAGNPMRFRTGPQRLKVDDAWRSEMPPGRRRLVSVITAPGLRQYGYQGQQKTHRPNTTTRNA